MPTTSSSRALQAEADPALRAARRAAQPVGQPVGPAVELAVGQGSRPRRSPPRRRGLPAPAPRRRPWSVDRARPGPAPRGRLPIRQELVALGRGEQRQLRGTARSGSADRRGQQALEVREQAVDRRAVEEVGVVLERARGARRRCSGEVERRGRTWPSSPAELDRPRREARRAPGLRRERSGRTSITWKSGERREAPLRAQLLDQPLEREVLVRIGAERRLAHPAEQLAEGRRSRQVAAQRPGC